MKFVFFGCLVLTLIPLLICVYQLQKVEKTPLRTNACLVVKSVMGVIMLYGMTLMTLNKAMALFLYSAFFLAVDIMSFSLCLYAISYSDIMERVKHIKVYMLIALILDVILMIVNAFKGNVFKIERCVDAQGNPFYNDVSRGNLYLIHVFACYIFICFAFVILVYRFLHCPKIFRIKYKSIIYTLIVTALVNTLYLATGNSFDFSLICYGLVAVAIIYFTFFHIPMGLMEKMLALFIKQMDDAIVCFDIKGKCLHYNDNVTKIYSEASPSALEKVFQIWLDGKKVEEATERQWEEAREIDGDEHIFACSYKRLMNNGRCIGGFFLHHDKTEEIRRVNQEKYRISHDRLTGVLNQEFFYKEATKMLDEHTDESHVLVCTDINDFKIVNDILGEEKGDEILAHIAETLSVLTPQDALCGRVGGDRFAICMKKDDFEEGVFRKELTKVERLDGNDNFRLRIYIGIYEIDTKDCEVSVMCDRSFVAMKSIKNDAEKRIVYYDDTVRQQSIREQNIITSFAKTLASGQFTFYVQPQMSVDGMVRGGEALVRWIHPERGLVPPGEFIDIFERTGLISKLDVYIWEQVCRQLRDWKNDGHSELYLSVNISPIDIFYLDIYKTITSLVEKYEIHPHNLKLEITETAVLTDMQKTKKLISRLRGYGFIVEMDDFGSGYSSLNMLKDIQIDTIKLDMGFLRSANKERSFLILKNIIELSKNLGLEIISEGVETKEQVDRLTEMGCDVFQGYYFSKPMSVWDFEDVYVPAN